MKNIAIKVGLFSALAFALAGCSGGGGGGTQIASSNITPTTIFTGSGTGGSALTVGTAGGNTIPLPANDSGGTENGVSNGQLTDVPEPSSSSTILLFGTSLGLMIGIRKLLSSRS